MALGTGQIDFFKSQNEFVIKSQLLQIAYLPFDLAAFLDMFCKASENLF